jgi:hypothetical protein
MSAARSGPRPVTELHQRRADCAVCAWVQAGCVLVQVSRPRRCQRDAQVESRMRAALFVKRAAIRQRTGFSNLETDGNEDDHNGEAKQPVGTFCGTW